MRILLVDDSKIQRKFYRRSLRKLGIDDVVEAEDGRQGLDRFETEAFDVILCDLHMPFMDGLAMLKVVRKRNNSIPFIMITSDMDRDTVSAAISAGCTGYIGKQFLPNDLAGLPDLPEDFKAKLTTWKSATAS